MNASTPLMQTLAWSLLHFLWQGAAIAALAGVCMLALRRPAARYLVGIGALALMLASFAITFTLSGEAPGVAREMAARAPAAVLASPAEARGSFVEPTADEPAAISRNTQYAWIARGWLAGVSLFALRVAFGLLLIAHLRRRNLVALPPALVARFEDLQRRLGLRRAIRYCECNLLRVPAVIGLLRPIVLLPMRALTGLSPEQLESVVAHELGHIRRFDIAVNFFQVIAETLFFFHPAVWWLNRRIRADREDCCDDVAIAACGGTAGYARALATMETWRDVPAFAMAANGSPVAARVARLLGVRPQGSASRTAGAVTASLVFATALAAGAMSIAVGSPAIAAQVVTPLQQLVAQAEDAAAAAAPSELPDEPAVSPAPPDVPNNVPQPPVVPVHAPKALPAVPARPPRPAREARPARDPTPAREPATAREPAPAREARPAREPSPPREPAPARDPAPPREPSHSGERFADAKDVSYIDQMKSTGVDPLDVDTLIELKAQDVTPDYVRAMQAAGFKPTVSELVALKVQDVTPEFVQGMRKLGFNPDVSELIAMRVQDVTPEYVQGMRKLGFTPNVSDLIAMRVQDVTPEFVQGMRGHGMSPTVSELIAMRVQDVTPEYRDMLASAGYPLNVSDLIEARVMDISPEFIEQAAEHGFRNLTFSKLVQLKNSDVF